jgi:hypothetical protein
VAAVQRHAREAEHEASEANSAEHQATTRKGDDEVSHRLGRQPTADCENFWRFDVNRVRVSEQKCVGFCRENSGFDAGLAWPLNGMQLAERRKR